MIPARYGVVHNGKCHRDEVLAVGLAIVLGIIDVRTPVYRREPSQEELEDPTILVLDVGGIHDPARNDFDHHQFDPEVEECALTLLAKAHNVPREFLRHGDPDITAHELLKGAPWYRGALAQDTKGPAGLARSVGLQFLPKELASPFEEFILAEIGNNTRIPETWMGFLRDMIASKVRVSANLGRVLDELHRNARFFTVNRVDGRKILVVDVTPSLPFALNEFVRRTGRFVSVTISKDPRTGGKTLYRMDEPAVDFSRLEGEPDVIFAHKQGFVAIAKYETGDARLAEMVLKSMV